MAGFDSATLDEPGKLYSFKNPLRNGECIAIAPSISLPLNAKPIIDDNSGACIGYSSLQAPGLWRIYDVDGRFVRLEEAPLETPLIDPIDIAFFSLGAFRLLRSGTTIFESTLGSKINIALSEGTLNFLRSRFKFGLSPSAIKFTRKTAERMDNPGRYIPINILERAVRYGSRGPDPKNLLGLFLYRIGMTRISRKIINGVERFTKTNYTLHVLVREKDWTIMHFHIDKIK